MKKAEIRVEKVGFATCTTCNEPIVNEEGAIFPPKYHFISKQTDSVHLMCALRHFDTLIASKIPEEAKKYYTLKRRFIKRYKTQLVMENI